MKTIKLFLIAIVALSCGEDEVEPQYVAATEYGIYVNNLDSEYSYRFYNFNTGETYRQGVAVNSWLLFSVTSKERENSHVVVEVFSNDESIEYFAIIKNGNLYLNDKDNPYATKISELNPFVNLDNGNYEGLVPVGDIPIRNWIDSANYSNN